ncbi:MAG TPA: nuclear transport factor 2 family protein [Pyrinomonadaceae bacterium]|nr:nuclear transport factor 2 family protein [Pyrinomonadaceae bacterium]
MERRPETSQRDAARTSANDPEKTRLAPHTSAAPLFDDAAVQQARPAEPLANGAPNRSRRARTWPVALVLLVTVSALAGGVLGGFVAAFFRGGPVVQPTSATRTQQSSAADSTRQPADATTNAQQPAPPADATTDGREAAGFSSNVTPASTPAPEEQAEARDAASPPDSEASADNTQTAAGAHAELRAALDKWIDATNARNVERQMNFYGERVSAFYLTRNATRAAVRAEKSRVFGRAASVNVNASEPEISVSPDGRTASMRFRKRYQIEGDGGGRRGEVLQELRWRRTADGWRIVSERDLRVLN